MEAVEFMRQRDRMCKYYSSGMCTHGYSGETCPAMGIYCDFTTDQSERLVSIVEQWAKEHPEKRSRNGRKRSMEK